MNRSSPSERFEPLWRTLQAVPGAGTPFQSLPWLRQWVRHRGQGLEPFTVVVDEGATVAPFARSRTWGLRVIELLGTGDSDFIDVVSRRESAGAWESVIGELVRQRGAWDLLHLHSVPARDAIVAAVKGHGAFSIFERIYEQCPVVAISGTWEAFLAAHKKVRLESKRWAKRLAEQGDVSAEAIATPLGEVLLREMVTVEEGSWKWEHGNAALRPGPQREFLFAMLSDPDMPARVWCLRIGGRLAAFAIVLHDSKRWYYYITGFRSEFKNSGSLLLARIVEAAHESECASVSLLQGDHGYKDDWSDAAEPVYEILVPSNLRGQAAAMAYRFRWRAAHSPLLRKLRGMLFKAGDRR